MSRRVSLFCSAFNGQPETDSGHPAKNARTGSEKAVPVRVPRYALTASALSLADQVGVGTAVRPGRKSNRTKTEPEQKVEKPAEGGRKKAPPARKAPSRGRYVDEYARPSA